MCRLVSGCVVLLSCDVLCFLWSWLSSLLSCPCLPLPPAMFLSVRAFWMLFLLLSLLVLSCVCWSGLLPWVVFCLVLGCVCSSLAGLPWWFSSVVLCCFVVLLFPCFLLTPARCLLPGGALHGAAAWLGLVGGGSGPVGCSVCLVLSGLVFWLGSLVPGCGLFPLLSWLCCLVPRLAVAPFVSRPWQVASSSLLLHLCSGWATCRGCAVGIRFFRRRWKNIVTAGRCHRELECEINLTHQPHIFGATTSCFFAVCL